MFPYHCRGIKVFVLLCVTVLLVVYSLQQSSWNNSDILGEGNDVIHANHKTSNTSPKKKEEKATNNVLISLVNLDHRPKIVRDFHACLSSICKHSSITITLHIVTDNRSKERAAMVITNLTKELCNDKVRVHYHDIDLVAREVDPLLNILNNFFARGGRSQYSGALFFFSIFAHTLFPDISKLIILDADLKFRTDIVKLWRKFDDFSPNNLIGIAHEMQPVYRHVMHQYRKAHPDTKIGSPPPNGHPGFNSGVLLMDLARMRNSTLFKSYLSNPTLVTLLAEKYFFKGHLGDQGFYTLLSFEHPELFYLLPCTWNRQLCTWWNGHGYTGVFSLYHNCDGYVSVYHGNCGTAIPED